MHISKVTSNNCQTVAKVSKVYQPARKNTLGRAFCRSTNAIFQMERALASLDNWFQANGLKVNAAKSQLMLLGSPQNLRSLNNIKVKFRDHNLLPITEAKNLGVIFDRSLSWDRHVATVTQRCFGVLTGLSHLRGHLPTAVLSALINALVLSQIRYCISVYGNGKKGNLGRLQKIINYAAKVLFGRRKYDHVSDLLERLGWLSAEGMATYHTLYLYIYFTESGQSTHTWAILRPSTKHTHRRMTHTHTHTHILTHSHE